MSQSPEFIHFSREGEKALLLLLHGTGGDEHDLVGLGDELIPGAAILSPRGKSQEEGVNRWFRRLMEGVFDEDDLHAKTKELAEFVSAQREVRGWKDLPLVAVGYSNGANIAASLLLSGSGVVDHAVLLRPMVPFEPDYVPNLTGSRVLIAAGKRDPICRPSEAMKLEELFVRSGAHVDVHWAEGGHGLLQSDLIEAREFLKKLL